MHAQNAPQGRTIEFSASSRPAAIWTVAPTPLLNVAEDAPSGLFNMTHVMRLSDDLMAIACEESFKLVNRTDTVVRTIGRRGRGPGEFVGGLVEAWHSADTLRGMGGDSRVGVFTSAGVLLRTEPRISLPGSAGWSRVGYYADGSQLIRSRQDPRTYPDEERFLSTLGVCRQQPDGTQRELGRFPASAMVRIEGNRAVRLKFGGSGVITPWRDGFCTGSSTSYAFACFDGNARKIFGIRNVARMGRPVTADDRALVFDVDARANPGPEGAPQREATRRNARFASRLPAFGRLLTSPSGDVWVGPADANDETVALKRGAVAPARWSVYSKEGRWSADVVLPSAFLLTEVGSDWIAGIRSDEDTGQQAIVFALRR